MKYVKRVLTVFLAAVIMFGSVSFDSGADMSVTANAATIAGNIQLLRAKFPHNKFWNHRTNGNHNHVGVYESCRNPACNNPDGWTDYPCSSHNGAVGIGGYDCNNFDNAIQCMGFAKKLFFDLHGVHVYDLALRYDRQNVSVGDYIRMLDDTHSALVIARNGDYITVAECNLYGDGNQCRIRWDHTYHISTINHFAHSDSIGTSLHQCSYGSNYVCAGCGAFNPASVSVTSFNGTFKIKSDDAIDHTGPYGACAKVNTYKKDTVVTAVAKVVNAHGHTWYKLSNGNYIYDNYLKVYTINYVDISAGNYRLRSVSNSQYLIVDEGKDVQGQNVSVWPLSETATEQKWGVSKDSLGYIITTKLGSRVLNPYADTITPGNNVTILTAGSGDVTQRWKLELVSGGYVIRNVANLTCVLTVENGHNVKLDSYRSGDKTQLWQFEEIYECSHNWNYSTVTKQPTCTETGIRTYTCSRCGGIRNEIIPVSGIHVYDNGTVTNTGTCKTEKKVLYKCVNCDYSYTQNMGTTDVHGNLQLARSGMYMSVSKLTCKSCGAEYTYDLGVKSVTAKPVDKNNLSIRIEFVDDRNIRKTSYLNYPATAVSSLYPNGIMGIVSGKITSQSMSGNVYVANVEYTDEQLKQFVGDKHSFHLKFENKNDPSNKYGYVQVIYEWHQSQYVNVKPGESVDAEALLGKDLAGYYLCKYDTDVVEHKDGVFTAKKPGKTSLVYCNNKTGAMLGFTVVVEAEKVMKKGDVDSDGMTSSADARLVLRYSVGLETFNEAQTANADIDKDSSVSSADARLILRYSVGIIDPQWK